MKIIELLNKIANGEEPKIKYNNFILKYNKNEKRFIDKNGLNSLYEIDFSELNDEVEIIEEETSFEEELRDKILKEIKKNIVKDIKEHKIPEKLDKRDFLNNETLEQVDADLDFIIDKINEILDYLEGIE